MIPVVVIARLLGVPDERADDLLGWSNAMVSMYRRGGPGHRGSRRSRRRSPSEAS
jgi:cytochrome P450